MADLEQLKPYGSMGRARGVAEDNGGFPALSLEGRMRLFKAYFCATWAGSLIASKAAAPLLHLPFRLAPQTQLCAMSTLDV